jgi:hypothetical protein
VILLVPGLRDFYELAIPNAAAVMLIVVGAAIAIGFLWLTDDRFVPLRRSGGEGSPGTMA